MVKIMKIHRSNLYIRINCTTFASSHLTPVNFNPLPQLHITPKAPPQTLLVIIIQEQNLLFAQMPPPGLQIHLLQISDFGPFDHFIDRGEHHNDENTDIVLEEIVHRLARGPNGFDPGVDAADEEEHGHDKEPDGGKGPGLGSPGIHFGEERVVLGFERGVEAEGCDYDNHPDHEEGGRGDGDEPGKDLDASSYIKRRN